MAQLFTPLRAITASGVGAVAVAVAGRRTVWADELKTPSLKKVGTMTHKLQQLGQIFRARRNHRPYAPNPYPCRRRIQRWYSRGHRQVDSGRFNPTELARVKSLISPDEPLTPGILYVGVAALSGSVFARGPLNYFLPKTTHNVNAYVYGLERAHAPALADTHDAADKALRNAVKQIRASYNSMRGGVSHIVEDSVDGLESTTGLKLRDATIGRVQQASEATHDKTSSIVQNIQEKTAGFQKRAAAIADDVQSKLIQQEAQSPQKSEASLERVKEKVEDAVSKVSKEVGQ
ncbi:ApoO domain-containing protein [Rhizoctonia solani AG-1 IA]|uniref:ApoO domain-containing protein n=1 Tax=Thanatephorus cucumeris (strain AG1-IA) TaxID=983506 RepID=L8WVM9_THACA|nr:ApoO domain-containing protein [Rhizoctonia solani AG-1 IA]